jgi:predicted nuclease with TOPRIM domain
VADVERYAESRRTKKLLASDEGADLLLVYSLADRLGKSAAEIVALPADELQGWVAYLSHIKRVSEALGRTTKK